MLNFLLKPWDLFTSLGVKGKLCQQQPNCQKEKLKCFPISSQHLASDYWLEELSVPTRKRCGKWVGTHIHCLNAFCYTLICWCEQATTSFCLHSPFQSEECQKTQQKQPSKGDWREGAVCWEGKEDQLTPSPASGCSDPPEMLLTSSHSTL